MPSRDLLGLVLEHAASGIALLNNRGVIIYSNPAAARILRMTKEEVNGSIAYGGGDKIIPLNIDGSIMAMEKTPAYRATVLGEHVKHELVGLRQADDDEITWVMVTAEPCHHGPDGARRIFLNFVDVTRETVNERRGKELIEQDAMLTERKTQFIQNTAHELRTPLTLVLGYLELLLKNDQDFLTPQQLGFLEVAMRRAQHMKAILNQILVFIEARHGLDENAPLIIGKFLPMDLSELVKLTVSDFMPVATAARVSLFLGEIEGGVLIYGNRTMISQALDNIITNAIKFTSGKDVAAASITVGVSVRIGGIVVVSVRDTGIGIPADKIGRIFDLFYQVDGGLTRIHSGNGLGLAVVKEVMHLHNGFVDVESLLGEGSIFFLKLPVFDGGN